MSSEHPCACALHPSGRGVQRCLYHEDVIREHQRMWRALDSMRSGGSNDLNCDPAVVADEGLRDVRYRH